MRIHQLILREIAHRKFNVAMGLLCVAVAAACAVGAVSLLRAFDNETEQLLGRQEEDARRHQNEVARLEETSLKAWDKFKDEVRKDMLELGFNLMILHKDQNLSNPDEHARTLPESYAQKLAASKLAVINHILPFLERKFWWEKKKRWVTLVGTSGEVYIKNPEFQRPMVQTVKPGMAILGRAIHESLGLKVRDKLTFAGREFAVQSCLGPRGFVEDESIYIPLKDAQKILNEEGRITGMLAVNCVICEPEELPEVGDKVRALLPGTRVIEHSTKLIARAKVRSKAARQADEELARGRERLEAAERSVLQTQQARADQRNKRATYGAVLIGLVVVVSAVFLGVLMWDNVHRRQFEIGILRAIGVTRRKVQALFLGRALLIGVVGAVVGYAGGTVVALVGSAGPGAGRLIDPALIGLTVLGAAILAAAASWVPLRLAAGIDPGVVLQREGL